MGKLDGRVAIVTGGSRGIGAASALALADEGADVAISYSSSADRAKDVVADLEAKGVRAAAFQADQADSTQSAGLIISVVQQFGKLDILVNNAAAGGGSLSTARPPTGPLSNGNSPSTTPAWWPRSRQRPRCCPMAGGSSTSARVSLHARDSPGWRTTQERSRRSRASAGEQPAIWHTGASP